MPAKSQAQRRWAFGAKGAKWTKKHHFDTPGPLPEKAGRKKRSVRGFKKRKAGGMKKMGDKPMPMTKPMMKGFKRNKHG